MSLATSQSIAVSWSALDPYPDCRAIDDAVFEELLAAAEALLAGTDDPEWVGCIASSAVDCFNDGQLDRAARLFAAAAPARRRIEAGPGGPALFDGTVASSDLDLESFLHVVGEPGLHPVALPLLRFFTDLSAASLLEQLAHETSVRRCEFIFNLLAAQSEDARLLVLNLLDWPEVQPHPSAYLVQLLTAVTHLGDLGLDDRRRCANLAGRYLVHPSSSVREAAVAALEFLGGRETILPLVRALTASRYGRDLPPENELAEHLARVLGLLARVGDDRSVAMVAEIAAGERDCGFKLGTLLQAVAVNALVAREAPPPPAAVRGLARRLMEVAANPLRLLTVEFIQSTEAKVWASLYRLLDASGDPAAEEALAEPRLRRLASSTRAS